MPRRFHERRRRRALGQHESVWTATNHLYREGALPERCGPISNESFAYGSGIVPGANLGEEELSAISREGFMNFVSK